MYRSHNLGELKINNVNEEVVLSGWVSSVRDLGGFAFFVLRDRFGETQFLVTEEESGNEILNKIKNIKNEYVLKVNGIVRERQDKNPKMKTGDIEILVKNIEILSESKEIPFPIKDGINLNENIRLKYRYLDIRRPKMMNNILKRDIMMMSIRQYMHEKGFVDLETPLLAKATPEGARDFVVPSRINKGSFYALPQSPQIFKQISMIAGLDRYYQLAKCFRDEDLRADRQLEFTQLDIEMSFINQEDILLEIEGLVKKVFRDVTGEEAPDKFDRITYKEAMDRYGSDKPDTRFGLELKDITEEVKTSEFKAFSSIASNGGNVKAIVAPDLDNKFSKSYIKKLEDYVKVYFGAKGLAWIKRNENGELDSPILKFFTEEEIEKICNKIDLNNNEVALIVADNKKIVYDSLGALRTMLGKELELYNVDEFKFLWVIDFPMFEWSEEDKRYKAQHHPFTAIKEEDIKYLDEDIEKVHTISHDIVLNGYEIGGGSIRIHDSSLQNKVFEKLGLSQEEAEDKFGFFLEALKYGVPPHGGIAFGFDRWLMVMMKEDSIKEVIPFPKTNKGQDLMMEAPAEVDAKLLEEELMIKSLFVEDKE